jgi:Ca2+-binding EF-hand superfamily protein
VGPSSAAAGKGSGRPTETFLISPGGTRLRWPEWLDELAAILRGEGMEDGKGWWRPSVSLHGWAWLRDRLDENLDGKLELREALSLGDHFDRLDRNEDGVLTREDLEDPEPAEPSALVRELFRSLDNDVNDRVSWDELSWFFQKTDRRKRGFITRRDLTSSLSNLVFREGESPAARSRGERGDDPQPSRGKLLHHFLTGQLGPFGEGPPLGGEAPDFSLPSLEDRTMVRLRTARGKRPVVLIFGSFT